MKNIRLPIMVWLVVAVTGLGSVVTVSTAQTENSTSAGGDIEYGRYLSSECVTCHQVSGVDKGIPSITGWEEEAFIAILNAYQDKALPNPVMQNVAANLDDEQIQALAAFFATLPRPN